MAKKDRAEKAGKAGKAKRIPKQIGGIKLSKTFRASAEKLIDKAQTPQGQQVLAAGLAMATAAVARAKMQSDQSPKPPAPPKPPEPPIPPKPTRAPGEGGTGTGTIDPNEIADAVGKAATAFIDGLFGRKK